MVNSLILLATMVATAYSTPFQLYGSRPTLKASDAMSRYPGAAALGSTIEGISCDRNGKLYAVNQTRFIDLSDASAKPIVIGTGGKESFYASSRFTEKYGPLIGDAVKHEVRTVSGTKICSEPKMLQPNDMTINRGESRMYLSGMNYTANTGDLWYVDLVTKKTKQCNLPKGTFYRTNGIELSPDDSKLYVTSAENSADGKSVVSAKIWKFDIDKKTGEPCNPTLAVDLYYRLTEMGLDPKTAGMDPDGMRMDSCGNLFVSLNAFQRVLKWDISKPCTTAQVIDLATVKYPSNLEFGGSNGKDLIIVGRCADGKRSCVDIYKHTCAGRAYTNLKSLPPGTYRGTPTPRPTRPSYGTPSKKRPSTAPKTSDVPTRSPPSYGTPSEKPKTPKTPDTPPSYGTPGTPRGTPSEKPKTPKTPDTPPSYGTPGTPQGTPSEKPKMPKTPPSYGTPGTPRGSPSEKPKTPKTPDTPSYGTPGTPQGTPSEKPKTPNTPDTPPSYGAPRPAGSY